MLPVFKAVFFDKIIESGGSTKPWIVYVEINQQLVPYVVKVYKEKHNEQYHATANEVYAYLFAQEFDLSTPEAALIDFDTHFINSLPNDKAQLLKHIDSRIKFGTRYIDGCFSFNKNLRRRAFDSYDVESIFAFDNLILNVDRRVSKSNILLKGKAYYLIDHEMSFSVNEHLIDSLKKDNWIFNAKSHIFFSHLKKSAPLVKVKFFGTFEEYLRNLRINKLHTYEQQLQNYGYVNENYALLEDYICYQKDNSTRFTNLLKSIIQ